jgi:hypothetical protein
VPLYAILGCLLYYIGLGWLVLNYPEIFHHLTLVDPVSLLLGLPEVAYHFLYRPPADFIQNLIMYGASREITISHMLHRHFWWHRNICYLEDIPSHIGVVVAVSSHDPILNPATVHKYSLLCNELRKQRAEAQDSSNAPELVEVRGIRVSRRIKQRKQRDDLSKSPITISVDSPFASTDSLTALLAEESIELPPSIFETSPDAEATFAPIKSGRSPAEIKTLYWQDFTHGQFLLSPSAISELIQAIKENEGISSWKAKCL